MTDNKNKKGNSDHPIKYIKTIKRFKISPFILVTVIVLIAFSLFSLFKKDNFGNQISVDELVANIKDNTYSTVDIRDDGNVVSYGKYVYIIDESINKDQFSDKKQTTIFVNPDGLRESSLDEFIDILTNDNILNLLKRLARNENAVSFKGILIGDDFIIGRNIDGRFKDYIVKGSGEKELLNALEEKGKNLSMLSISKVYLRDASKSLDKSTFMSLYDSGKIVNVWILDNKTVAELNASYIAKDTLYWRGITTDFSKFLQGEGVSFNTPNTAINSVQVPVIPWSDIISIITLVGIGLLAVFLLRGIQGSSSKLMQFGQSKAKLMFGKKQDITFKDVAGIEEAKEELKEIVLFLKDPKRFLKMGARIPKGILLVGAPGTGKTLLARAIAGEAGVPFFHTSGAEFEEMLVGAGASRVRDLFTKAKRAAPALIFIDEIDAVARKRGTTIQSSSTEQTLNQILVEMDGFEKNENVIVIAATNRPDVLDPAILRPGRFDRRIVLDMPDIEGREKILKIHARNKPLDADVDLKKVAKRTVGFSGADIENMLNEAAIIAAKDERKTVNGKDIEEAATKVVVGPERRRKRTKKEIKATAYHEAGHAIAAKFLPESDPVHRITIISRGMSLGSTLFLPKEDELLRSRTKMLSEITGLLGGRVAEELMVGDISTGAANDIERASDLARKMVKKFGMSDKLGNIEYGKSDTLEYLGYAYSEQRDYSETTAHEIDVEVKKIIDECYMKAKDILTKNKEMLEKLTNLLLEKEVVESSEFEKLFEKK